MMTDTDDLYYEPPGEDEEPADDSAELNAASDWPTPPTRFSAWSFDAPAPK